MCFRWWSNSKAMQILSYPHYSAIIKSLLPAKQLLQNKPGEGGRVGRGEGEREGEGESGTTAQRHNGTTLRLQD